MVTPTPTCQRLSTRICPNANCDAMHIITIERYFVVFILRIILGWCYFYNADSIVCDDGTCIQKILFNKYFLSINDIQATLWGIEALAVEVVDNSLAFGEGWGEVPNC